MLVSLSLSLSLSEKELLEDRGDVGKTRGDGPRPLVGRPCIGGTGGTFFC